jgi:hypothetical protein
VFGISTRHAKYYGWRKIYYWNPAMKAAPDGATDFPAGGQSLHPEIGDGNHGMRGM